MLMAFLYWEVRINHGWPAWIALVFVVLIAAPLFGAVIERTLMRRLVDAPLVVQLVVTIGLMFFLMGLAATIWDENSISPLPEFFADKHGIDIGDVVLTWHRFVTIAVAVLIAIFLRHPALPQPHRRGDARGRRQPGARGPQRRAARPGVGAGVGAGLDDGGDRGDPAGAERRAAGRRAHALHRRRVRRRDHRPIAQPAVDVRRRARSSGSRRASRSTSCSGAVAGAPRRSRSPR